MVKEKGSRKRHARENYSFIQQLTRFSECYSKTQYWRAILPSLLVCAVDQKELSIWISYFLSRAKAHTLLLLKISRLISLHSQF